MTYHSFDIQRTILGNISKIATFWNKSQQRTRFFRYIHMFIVVFDFLDIF